MPGSIPGGSTKFRELMHKDTNSTVMRKGNHVKGGRYGNKRKMVSILKKKGRREERHQLNKIDPE